MDLEKVFQHIEKNKEKYINYLKEWVSYKTVSAVPCFRKDCIEFVSFAKKSLVNVGVECTMIPNPLGKQTFPCGAVEDYPPLLLGSLINDPSFKTVCIYGHLDVQPADKEDGWSTDPFELTIKGDEMFARGSSDDKGPVLGWICLLEALKDLKMKLSVNLKFIFECMEESGSAGLDEVIKAEKDKFLKNVDYVCISDNYWVGTKKPCVTYGLRGIMYFYLEVIGPKCDLHSGLFGGTIREPMCDLISLMGKLVDGKGNILIPGVCDEVTAVSDEEKQIYSKIDFDSENYAKDIGCANHHLLHPSKVETLMHRWRYPSLSLHGIEGAFSGAGEKTVIPCKVTGKFSIRIVPNMSIKHVHESVEKYIKHLVDELKSPNKINLVLSHGAPAWVSDYKTPNFQAAIRAVKKVYNVDPDLTREGGSIPVALTFEEILGKSVVLLPMGRGDDGAHSQNEKLNISNYIMGIKTFGAYLSELSN